MSDEALNIANKYACNNYLLQYFHIFTTLWPSFSNAFIVVSTSKTLCDCIVNVPNIHFTWAFLNHGLSNQKNDLIQHEKVVSNGMTMGQHQRKLHSTYNSYLECQ